MRVSELKNKTKHELSEMLKEYRAKITQLNFNLAEKKLKDFSQIKKTKKDIARVLTFLKTVK